MSSTGSVIVNGKRIPFTKWATREYRKLHIKMECANAPQELRAIKNEIEQLDAACQLMNCGDIERAVMEG